MHSTDDFTHRAGLMVARTVASSDGLRRPDSIVAEVRPTESECLAYMQAAYRKVYGIHSSGTDRAFVEAKAQSEADPLEGFTILHDADGDLWDDDGA